MGLRQSFRFRFNAPDEVTTFLRSFAAEYRVDDRGDFFVIEPKDGAAFLFDCQLVQDGLLCDRSGEYFHFLGIFLEQLTGRFGKVEVEDA